MRDYDVSLVSRINEQEFVQDINGLKVLVKPVPDDERENVLDPRVLQIAIKKANRVSGLKKGFSLASERYRPDKISYDLTTEPVECMEKLIKINDDHMIDIFMYRPEAVKEKAPVLIYFHGGGFTAGDMKLYANQMKLISQLSGALVVFPEYRLAPECPYPGPIEDGVGTIRYIVEHADELNIDVNRLMVAGDSAGGALLNSCLLRDEKGYIKKGFGIYPAVDSISLQELDLYSWSYDMYPIVEEQKEYAFSRIDKIKKAAEHSTAENSLYLQGKTSSKNPDVSIVYATDQQLKKLPPMVIAYSEYDFLKVSDEYFAKRLQDLGNEVKTIKYCGCDHGFLDCLGLVPQAEELCYTIAEEIKSL